MGGSDPAVFEMAKILFVDDDRDLLQVVRDSLRFEHHLVETTTNARDTSDLLAVSEFDLIILDLGLPDGSGLEILRELRSRGCNTPVLILTGRNAIEEKTEGLDLGADDYLTKPFHMKELASRVRALIRRSAGQTSNILKASCLVLDAAAFRVTKLGQEIKLAPIEFSLLEFLMRHPNRAFSSEYLLNRVWASPAEVGLETVRTCVKRLRKKLGTYKDQQIVDTIHSLGYRFNAPELAGDKNSDPPSPSAADDGEDD